MLVLQQPVRYAVELLEIHGRKIIVDEFPQTAMLGQPIMGEQLTARRRHPSDDRTDGRGLLRAVET